MYEQTEHFASDHILSFDACIYSHFFNLYKSRNRKVILHVTDDRSYEYYERSEAKILSTERS